MTSPRDGYLASPQDLEQCMNQQEWLNATREVRQAAGVDDAWAEGDTDNAFAFNNFTCIENSHRDNTWTEQPIWFKGLRIIEIQHDFSAIGRGLYVYRPSPARKVQNLSPVIKTSNTVANQRLTNATDKDTQETKSYTQTDGSEVTITDSRTIGYKATGEVEMAGFKFSIEASLDTTNTQARNQSSVTTVSTQVEVPISAHSTAVFCWVDTEESQDQLWEVDFTLGDENPGGSIAIASTRPQYGDWNFWERVEDVLARRGLTGVQTIQYKLTTVTKMTNIYMGPVNPDGTVSWDPQFVTPPDMS